MSFPCVCLLARSWAHTGGDARTSFSISRSCFFGVVFFGGGVYFSGIARWDLHQAGSLGAWGILMEVAIDVRSSSWRWLWHTFLYIRYLTLYIRYYIYPELVATRDDRLTKTSPLYSRAFASVLRRHLRKAADGEYYHAEGFSDHTIPRSVSMYLPGSHFARDR